MTVARNQPFHVQADHDGVDTETYELKIDGAVVATEPVANLQTGVITFDNVMVTQVGNHTAAVNAVGPAGSAESDPLPFDVVPGKPGKPTNVRLTVV
jgi:hypothetical protein